ncbi:hypothetical protein P5673_017161 [Acropora cervicornis]|uniref:Uncharacterized protein n=1 Tax=Acropora cervicornis TaxID=6130 RepID=A0AAD9QF82_ACRCE|nr:hypothetical protein P5673_017161 [Acropora cervicornis]
MATRLCQLSTSLVDASGRVPKILLTFFDVNYHSYLTNVYTSGQEETKWNASAKLSKETLNFNPLTEFRDGMRAL